MVVNDTKVEYVEDWEGSAMFSVVSKEQTKEQIPGQCDIVPLTIRCNVSTMNGF